MPVAAFALDCQVILYAMMRRWTYRMSRACSLSVRMGRGGGCIDAMCLWWRGFGPPASTRNVGTTSELACSLVRLVRHRRTAT
jgi:hypothetical protein